MAAIPESAIDLYHEQVSLDPYPAYNALRDLGPIAFLPQYDMHVFSRFKDVQEAMRSAQVFSSAQGVMMNERMNQTLRGIVLCSDDPEHQVLRRIISKHITPLGIKATELAQYLPITVVSNLVGLPEDGRERMLDWAAANFECFGPLNERTVTAFKVVEEMVTYAFTQCMREKLKPDGWVSAIWAAADRGEIPLDKPPLMMNDYIGPSLDTTIFTISSAIWLFAQHPEQWTAMRENESLLPGAIAEVLRLESPLQGFSRVATSDVEIEEFSLAAGSRVLMSWGLGEPACAQMARSR